jgi:hypothetical protein
MLLCGLFLSSAMKIRNKWLALPLAISLISLAIPTAIADPLDKFPTGPYSATLILEKILYPSLFGVAAGLPVADVSGVQLSDGTIRAYVFCTKSGNRNCRLNRWKNIHQSWKCICR